ncbi:iron-containing redox enzyme family protein [Paenarthrobacter sp. Z7-10]|uniref:iron-containing redox enzyme family protein n=1 Tax=Paenarthrobacter sp. Z7-10 TaxID=2787635 RepID=UPI0022A98ECD|nr:iron-containing redox enzyme family protein [Paenarthrobacter sp. Z7-10]MCZ2402985.1 iron-containing redox enzyme family protein [Paenarthrobacter sp. Z7-10]
MKFPSARGPVSASLLDVLRGPADQGYEQTHSLRKAATQGVAATESLISDEDLQLALFCLYELHYGGLDGADERWEWNLGLLAVRQGIEARFEQELRAAVELPDLDAVSSDEVASVLFGLAAVDSGPSMSRYVAKEASLEQLREFLVHKAIYQLKEADPHTWAIPRLNGRPKAAMVEIQADEYGGGRPDRMHSALFARTMRGLALDDTYGAYVDAVPALTLASTNMMSMFGLNRRLRGAIVGHLAIYEMTSAQPNKFYGNGFRRHGFSSDVTWYFDEHVEADAVHEQIAGRDLAGGLVESEPALLADVYFGAMAALAVDAQLSARTMAAWKAGDSSLRAPLPVNA